jgi:hypothetical protein
MREGDPKGWSTVLVTALGSWEKTVPYGPQHRYIIPKGMKYLWDEVFMKYLSYQKKYSYVRYYIRKT